MNERQPGHNDEPSDEELGQGDVAEHPKGGLSPAPATPTEEKAEPEAGTASADKRSPESLAEQGGAASGETDDPGAAGGDITR